MKIRTSKEGKGGLNGEKKGKKEKEEAENPDFFYILVPTKTVIETFLVFRFQYSRNRFWPLFFFSPFYLSFCFAALQIAGSYQKWKKKEKAGLIV